MYNVPSRTGVNIEANTVKELSKIDNIVGIKEASGNLSQVATIASKTSEDFSIYSGNDDQILPVLSLGGKGVISVLANIAPKETHDMVKMYLNKDIKQATYLQLEYLDLIHALFSDVNPIPVKDALNAMGFDYKEPRKPLVSLNQEKHKILVKEMKKKNIIK